ncbi:MAG: phosphoglycerate dehydrogenase-like enzyme [Bradymonadia bacterium]
MLHIHHNAAAVAETAIGLLFSAAKRIPQMDRSLRQLDWRPRYAANPALRLAGKRALLLGYGEIGARIESILRAIGVNVVVIRRVPRAVGEQTVDALPTLLPNADILISTLPSTPMTRGLIGAPELNLLPPHAVIVNVGRADVFDECALYGALKQGSIGSAALDVWYHYPSDEASRVGTAPSAYPFEELTNVVLSPHSSGHDTEVESDRVRCVAEVVAAITAGEDVASWAVDLVAGY